MALTMISAGREEPTPIEVYIESKLPHGRHHLRIELVLIVSIGEAVQTREVPFNSRIQSNKFLVTRRYIRVIYPSSALGSFLQEFMQSNRFPPYLKTLLCNGEPFSGPFLFSGLRKT